MTSTLTFAAFALISTLNQNPPLADTAAVVSGPVSVAAAQGEVRPTGWELSVRALQPVTPTDPQHVGVGVGLAHTGAYRLAVQYQPTPNGRFGSIQASMGLRVRSSENWQLALDLEHSQVRPVRRGFQGSGWELEFHDRHQVSLGTATITWREPRFLGLVTAFEVGFGRMHVWRLVSARAGATTLSTSPDPILESSAPVGAVGLRMDRALFWGLQGRAHVRVLGAGHSRGGEVPFALATAEWDVTRQIFQSKKLGQGFLGLSGTHASHARAVTYYQNGVGLVLRAKF